MVSKPQWLWLPHPEHYPYDYGDPRAYALVQSISALVRETAQNSLDAATSDGQVAMRFRLIDLPNGCTRRVKFERRLDFATLRSHLESVVSSKKPKEVADRLRHSLHIADQTENTLRLLVVEDYGAKGLKGDEFASGSAFAALLRNTRDSQKKDEAAGGSFGLGSGTLWAASRYLTVLFASRLVDEEDKGLRILGKSGLGYHKQGRKAFTGPGFFGQQKKPNIAESLWASDSDPAVKDLCLDRIPIPNFPCSTGTSALIVAFYDPASDNDDSVEILENLRRAIAENLWPAIVRQSLKVYIRYEDGDKHAEAVDIEVNPENYVPSFVDAYRKHLANELQADLVSPGDVVSIPVSHRIPGTREDADTDIKHAETDAESRLVVRLASGNEIDHKRIDQVAYSRGRAMVVQYSSKRNVGMNARPFHAVLLAGTLVGDDEANRIAERFFRNAEPPAHDRWEFWDRVKSLYQLGARKLLISFFETVYAKLKEAVDTPSNGSDDGPEGLRSLVTIPKPVTAEKSTWRIKSPLVTTTGKNVAFEFVIEIDEPAANTFLPAISLATDSGRAVALTITELVVDGEKADIGKPAILPKGKKKLMVSGQAVSDMANIDLNRCAVRMSGTLMRAG